MKRLVALASLSLLLSCTADPPPDETQEQARRKLLFTSTIQQLSDTVGPKLYRGSGAHALFILNGLSVEAWVAWDDQQTPPQALQFQVDPYEGSFSAGEVFTGRVLFDGSIEGSFEGTGLRLAEEDPAQSLSGWYRADAARIILLESGGGRAWMDLSMGDCHRDDVLNFDGTEAVSVKDPPLVFRVDEKRDLLLQKETRACGPVALPGRWQRAALGQKPRDYANAPFAVPGTYTGKAGSLVLTREYAGHATVEFKAIGERVEGDLDEWGMFVATHASQGLRRSLWVDFRDPKAAEVTDPNHFFHDSHPGLYKDDASGLDGRYRRGE